jgi:protein SCO1/2
MNRIHRNLLYVLFGIACMGMGILIASQKFSSPPELKAVQLLPGSKKITDIDLQSTRRHNIHSDFFSEHWTLIFFGFTSCPDFCPMELQKMSKALRLVGNTDLQVLFVSVDPERDSQEKLRGYVEFFHPDIVGATGNNQEIAKFAQMFGAAYDRSYISDKKVHEISAGMDMPADADDYQVNHSLRIFIVNPRGEYVGSFAPPYDAEMIQSDMMALMK